MHRRQCNKQHTLYKMRDRMEQINIEEIMQEIQTTDSKARLRQKAN